MLFLPRPFTQSPEDFLERKLIFNFLATDKTAAFLKRQFQAEVA
jgi:hypothetical protein